MRCPYCAEEIKDEAAVCKYCHRDLFVIKPLIAKINELSAREVSLEQAVKHDAEVLSHARHAPARSHGWGLTGLEAVALGYITHVVVHFLINVQFDLKLIYFKIASIAVPMIFGALWRQADAKFLATGLLLGLAIAVTAIPSELAVIAAVDKKAFLPTNSHEWNEFALHSASIAFGFLTGVIVRQLLMAIYVPNAKSNRSIEWTARFIVEQFGDGKGKFTLRAVRSMVSSVLGFASAIVSILAGLWEYMLK